MIRRPDTGQHQQLGRIDRAARQDDLALGADLAKMANASGIKKAVTVSNVEDFKKNLREIVDETELSVLVAKIETGTIKVPHFSMDGKRNKYIFAGHIEETEKKPVLRLRSQSPLVE